MNKLIPWTQQAYMVIGKDDLAIEFSQCSDEGKDLTRFQAEFDALTQSELDSDMSLQPLAGRLLDKTCKRRPETGSPFKEPSDLAGIRKARRNRFKLPDVQLSDEQMLDKALGGWQGRSAGCLLGRPVEGRMRQQIEAYLKSQNRWPLADFFSGQVAEDVRAVNKFPAPGDRCFRENITCMVEDDDMNYTTTGLAIVEKYGKDFKPADVAAFWLAKIPLLHTFTAERVAYRNLSAMIPPPGPDGTVAGRFSSATFRNPYREWIGAQIRADFYGYVNPANPERAADFAWRDACISHIKNGIYGEMWVAAMLAGAYVVSDNVEQVIRIGMGEIPAKSRLHADLTQVLNWRAEGLDYWTVVDRIHTRWNQANRHHWCHTNSNAQIVAVALLWGELDYGRTICGAVMPGFDTDCNGATAGSVLGVMLGAGKLPSEWITPMNDTLQTGVAGYHQVKLTQMAAKTLLLTKMCL